MGAGRGAAPFYRPAVGGGGEGVRPLPPPDPQLLPVLPLLPSSRSLPPPLGILQAFNCRKHRLIKQR